MPFVKTFRDCNASDQCSPLEMAVWQQLILGTGRLTLVYSVGVKRGCRALVKRIKTGKNNSLFHWFTFFFYCDRFLFLFVNYHMHIVGILLFYSYSSFSILNNKLLLASLSEHSLSMILQCGFSGISGLELLGGILKALLNQ